MDEDRLKNIIKKLLILTTTSLPLDVVNGLKRICKGSDNVLKLVCDLMLENLDYAHRGSIPLCQDTGIPIFYVDLGAKSPFKELIVRNIDHIVKNVVRELTLKGFLRPNVIDPLTRKNTGDNVGVNIPWIELSMSKDSSDVLITLYLATGGSNLLGRALTYPILRGIDGLIDLIINTLADLGYNACPPLVVGIGLGPTAEIAIKLARKALLRPIGSRNKDPRIASLESKLFTEINRLGIGIQGLGQGPTLLDLHVEYASTHVAILSVGIMVSCWALRRSILKISPEGKAYVISHGVELS